jgi:hypothetical protein
VLWATFGDIVREEASHGAPNAHVVYRQKEAERGGWGIERAALKKKLSLATKRHAPLIKLHNNPAKERNTEASVLRRSTGLFL